MDAVAKTAVRKVKESYIQMWQGRIDIGHMILQAKTVLPPAEFELLLCELPMGRKRAREFMRIALRAADGHKELVL